MKNTILDSLHQSRHETDSGMSSMVLVKVGLKENKYCPKKSGIVPIPHSKNKVAAGEVWELWFIRSGLLLKAHKTCNERIKKNNLNASLLINTSNILPI